MWYVFPIGIILERTTICGKSNGILSFFYKDVSMQHMSLFAYIVLYSYNG